MGAWSVRSAHTRAVLGAAAAAAVLAASIGSLPASATGAAKKGTGVWTKISTPKVSGIDEPGVLRLKDGRLLVVYYHEAPSGKAGYGSTIVTAKGKAMTDRIDAAREKLVGAIFAQWSDGDIQDLVRLTRKFADAFKADLAGSSAIRQSPR